MSPEKSAYSIQEFCNRVEISVPTFYRNRAEMPKTITIGKQVRILAEDLAEWTQAKREAGKAL